MILLRVNKDAQRGRIWRYRAASAARASGGCSHIGTAWGAFPYQLIGNCI